MQERIRFNVCVATYETVSQEATELRKIDWETLIVDEAHRLKNNQSRCGHYPQANWQMMVVRGSCDIMCFY